MDSKVLIYKIKRRRFRSKKGRRRRFRRKDGREGRRNGRKEGREGRRKGRKEGRRSKRRAVIYINGLNQLIYENNITEQNIHINNEEGTEKKRDKYFLIL